MKLIRYYIILALVLALIAGACAPVATESPETAPPPEEKPTEPPVELTAEPPVGQIDTPEVTIVDRLIFSPPKGPVIPTFDKPRLEFFKGAEGLGEQVIGFTFPDGPGGLKAAPFMDIYSYPYGPDVDGKYTPVGLVEMGEGSEMGIPAGTYLVMLELSSPEPYISGEIRLLSDGSAYGVGFWKYLQSRNWTRFDVEKTPYSDFAYVGSPPDNSVTITANGVCFILKTGDASMGQEYIRYCSEPGSVLSPQANFPFLYGGLKEDITKTAEIIKMPPENLQYEQLISEMEDVERIKGCGDANVTGNWDAVQQVCRSDITVAPVKDEVFWAGYDYGKSQMKPQSFLGWRYPLASALSLFFKQDQDDPYAGHFPVTVAAIQVLNPIDNEPLNGPEDGSDIVQPGDYQVDYWFDSNGDFYAASISGWRDDGIEVIRQRIPAVPSTFVNADGSQQDPTQISTCRIFGWCVFFQRNCP